MANQDDELPEGYAVETLYGVPATFDDPPRRLPYIIGAVVLVLLAALAAVYVLAPL